MTLPQIEAMVESLAKRLESQTAPQEGDLQAWTMLDAATRDDTLLIVAVTSGDDLFIYTDQ